MTILKSSALILWLAHCALAAPGRPARPARPAPSLESLVRDSRAAYFRGEYEESAQLAMEVLLEESSHDEARNLLRLSAKVLAELNVRLVQEERAKLMEGLRAAQAKREEDQRLERELRKKEDKELAGRLEGVERDRPLWSAWTRAYVSHGELLEAYQLIFQVKDQFPREGWVLPQLERLRNVLARDAAQLDKRSPEYREAVLGYSAYADGKFKDAVVYWRSALDRPPVGALLPREAIERRLTEARASASPEAVPAQAKRSPRKAVAAAAPVAPPATSQPAPSDPKEVQSLYTQGLVQYGFGHVAEAAETWERVLRLDPKHPSARRALARARHELEGKR